MADEKLIKQLRKDLIIDYRQNVRQVPISPLVEDHQVPVVDLYVQTQLKSKEFSRLGKEKSEGSTIYSYKDVFMDRGKPCKNVYVSSDAGMGKTIFSRMMAMTWCQAFDQDETYNKFKQDDIQTMKKFDLLFHLDMQSFRGSSECDLCELVLRYIATHIGSSDSYSKKFVEDMLNTGGCLIILDGIDQWVHPDNCSRKDSVIPHNRHNRCSVLTTVRSWKLSVIGLKSKDIDRCIEITDLTRRASQKLESKAIRFLSAYMNRNSERDLNSEMRNIDDFDSLISSAQLEEVRLKPYILLQQICMWFDKRKIRMTKFGAYSSVIEITLERGIRDIERESMPTSAAGDIVIPDYVQDEQFRRFYPILLKLGHVAFESLCNKAKDSAFEIENDFITRTRTLDEKEKDFLLKVGFISQSKDPGIISKRRFIISFQDKSVQEVFAALYMASRWKDDIYRKNIIDQCMTLPSILVLTSTLNLVKDMDNDIYEDIYNKVILRNTDTTTRSGTKSRNILVYGGRLIQFQLGEKEELVQDCIDGKNLKIGDGSFGPVFKSDILKERCGITLAVKKIDITKRLKTQQKQVMDVVNKEMYASKLRHPFILPTMAVLKDVTDNTTIFYCISPFCENGDLYTRLHLSDPQDIFKGLNQKKRVRIVLQVALGIHYLHTPVQDVREEILHKDICSANIVLDGLYNARLIDFGLARCAYDITTSYTERSCYHHPEVGRAPASKKWDYYALGVVTRELLTGMLPTGSDDTFLGLWKSDDILRARKKEIWPVEELFEKLNKFATTLITATDSFSTQELKKNIDELKCYFEDHFEAGIMDYPTEKNCKRCVQCMVNPEGSEREATENMHKSKPKCRERRDLRVCIPCEKGLYVNPVTCYGCGGELEPHIGKNWGAILIAGNDEHNAENAKILCNDVKNMERVLTSQSPLIMGLRKEHVTKVLPAKPGKEDNNLLKRVEIAFEKFPMTKIQTLVFYFSGHGKENKSFKLGSDEDVMTTDKLEHFLESLIQRKCVRKVILLLDRCYCPEINLKGSDVKKIQINACAPENEVSARNKESDFTKVLIEGLKSSSANNCKDKMSTGGDFISAYDLYRYTKKRLKDKPIPVFSFPTGLNTEESLEIAYNNSEPVTIDFQCEDRTESLQLDLFQDMDNLKLDLLTKFDKDATKYTVRIFKDTFKKKDELLMKRNETASFVCDSVEKVMTAKVLDERLNVVFESVGNQEHPAKMMKYD